MTKQLERRLEKIKAEHEAKVSAAFDKLCDRLEVILSSTEVEAYLQWVIDTDTLTASGLDFWPVVEGDIEAMVLKKAVEVLL